MRSRFILYPVLLLLLSIALFVGRAAYAESTPSQTQFFQDRIEPVLRSNCYKCHSHEGEKIKGNLLLDSSAGVRRGGDSGPIITPGDPERSLLVKALRWTDTELKMPPRQKLTDRQIDDVVEWIKMGAPDPRGGAISSEPATLAFTAAEKGHWAYQPVKRPQPPRFGDADADADADAGKQNPIDAFILASLQAQNRSLASEADRITLIRRASFDLVGLPPAPKEVAAFLSDTSADAYEKLIDRLLASPHYGERWGRHWLDLARFAETDGFKDDGLRPNAWRYRDYVIRSFNEDKPYDRFIREQIAGDELYPEDPDARIATAFNRHYPDEWNARNLFQRRQEILNDITDTVASVFMGMTVGCARCHNHKYDAIRQIDYYRLQAFFANTSHNDHMSLLSPQQQSEYRSRLSAWEEQTRPIRQEIAAIEKPHIDAAIKEYFEKYPPEIQAMLVKPAAERTPYERMMAAKAKQYLEPDGYRFVGAPDQIAGKIKGKDKERYEQLKKQLQEYRNLHPGDYPETIGMTDLGADAPPTHLLHRGNYDQPRDSIAPGFLSVLDPAPAKVTPRNRSTGRRTALANILADPKNPLTARVMVNRIWHYHFGTGIVATPSDFGVKGAPPSHPELLDYLAHEFMRSGWRMKPIHRLIMTSRTYRQSSSSVSVTFSPGAPSSPPASTPAHQLFSPFPRQRLEAEAIRDALLAVAGLLDTRLYGPSIFPEVPAGAANRLGLWKVTADPAERNRRSVYVFVRRNNRYAMLEPFDMPDTLETCARRNTTTTPLQALTLLNSELTLDWARHFAARVIEKAGRDRAAQIEQAYLLAYSRPPTAREMAILTDFFDRHASLIADRLAGKEPVPLPPNLPADQDASTAATLVDLCHALMNSNEFVYRN